MALTLAIVGKTLFDADVEHEAAEIGEALATTFESFHFGFFLPFGELLERLAAAGDAAVPQGARSARRDDLPADRRAPRRAATIAATCCRCCCSRRTRRATAAG